jgi:tRNA1(Val) A37 N6-methylase TrmN6
MVNDQNTLKLITSYDAQSINSAIIQHWAKTNEINTHSLSRATNTQEIIEKGDPNSKSEIATCLNRYLPSPTLKDVEKIFERSTSGNLRKSFGVVYTPEYIIDNLISSCIGFITKPHSGQIHLCDPSCGSGGFLLKAAEIMEKEMNVSGEKAFSEYIFGIDINQQAVQQARSLIELYLLSRKQTIPRLEETIIQLDTLVRKKNEILSLLKMPNGFEVIVTNPPYVKLQNLENEYRRTLLNEYRVFADGNFSLSTLFLAKGYELLSTQGFLGMITQNNIFTSLSGKGLREFFQNKECLRRVIDFSHFKVFENASAYTCLIYLSKRAQESFEYSNITSAGQLTLENIKSLQFDKIKIESLKSIKWRLAKPSHSQNISVIEKTGVSLGSVVKIRVGFATLKDNVYFARKIDGHCFARSMNNELIEIEEEVTRPAVKVSEVSSELELAQNSKCIIFPYTKRSKLYECIPEQELAANFPKVYAYLVSVRSLLESRDKGNKKYQQWYSWARSQGMEAPGPKLLTKTFNKSPQFFFDSSDQLFCNGYSVSLAPKTLFDFQPTLKYVERIVNSIVMFYYAKITSFQIEGGYQCYQKNFIERFGIPVLNSSEMDSIGNLDQNAADEALLEIYKIKRNDVNEILQL